MGAARTPDGLESGGRDSPDGGATKEFVVDTDSAGVGGGGGGAARPLGGGSWDRGGLGAGTKVDGR